MTAKLQSVSATRLLRERAGVRAAYPTATFPPIEQLRVWLGYAADDDTHDAEILAALDATLAIIESYLGRGIQQVTGPENVEPVNSRNRRVPLFRFPITDVQSVTVDGTAVTGWRVFADQGVIEWADAITYGWSRAGCHDPILVVTYTGGFADDAWPADLLAAVMGALAAHWQLTGAGSATAGAAPPGPVQSLTVDGLAVVYRDSASAMTDFGGGPIPPALVSVAAMLEPYRNRLATGV